MSSEASFQAHPVFTHDDGDGEIEAALLTTDSELQRRIAASPGLQWKALNVKKHAAGLDE